MLRHREDLHISFDLREHRLVNSLPRTGTQKGELSRSEIANMEEPPEVLAAKASNPSCSFGTSRTDSLQIVNGRRHQSSQTDYFMQCPGDKRKLIASRRSEDGVDIEPEAGPGSSFSMEDMVRDMFGPHRPWVSKHAESVGSWPPVPWPFAARPQHPPSSAPVFEAPDRRPDAESSSSGRRPPSFVERERSGGVSI